MRCTSLFLQKRGKREIPNTRVSRAFVPLIAFSWDREGAPARDIYAQRDRVVCRYVRRDTHNRDDWPATISGLVFGSPLSRSFNSDYRAERFSADKFLAVYPSAPADSSCRLRDGSFGTKLIFA